MSAAYKFKATKVNTFIQEGRGLPRLNLGMLTLIRTGREKGAAKETEKNRPVRQGEKKKNREMCFWKSLLWRMLQGGGSDQLS